ncbi:hypothetical protein ECG_07921 [Echinococcus granulosus]|uniref:Expressed protein n=1 Tax=Echinococcus granulosus TaxID=6210 RepID=A0A068WX23_ECHGR|nr:hypothetical protein ECG_07921 [Echinococcus granulosus]CDS22192.1 expressed protein [Echinococcus granulosus]
MNLLIPLGALEDHAHRRKKMIAFVYFLQKLKTSLQLQLSKAEGENIIRYKEVYNREGDLKGRKLGTSRK